MSEHRLLCVTGCPRSGTLYSANVWRRAGLDIGHEHTRGDGTVSFLFGVNDPAGYPAMPWAYPKGRCAHVGERRDYFEFQCFWHQVRTPLKTIGSMALVVPNDQWDWFRRHIPLAPPRADKRLLGLELWVRWNKLCQEQAQWTYCVEDMPRLWPRMLLKLGLRPRPMPDVRKDMHRSLRWGKPFVDKEKAKNTPDPTWSELELLSKDLVREARALAERYGYDPDSGSLLQKG